MSVENASAGQAGGSLADSAQKLGKPIVVQKYGGSSVATVELMRNVARRVVAKHNQGNAVVVVVSAMGGATDALIRLSREITTTPERREMDMLLHSGEIKSAALLAMAVTEAGVSAVAFTGQQAGMRTDESHTQARIRKVDGARILVELARGKIVVVAGFQGVSENLEVTTLGRGGSDTSAVAIAVGMRACACEILTDVDGVYTSDPRIVAKPRKLEWCSYDEMLELAILGAKVLHSRSVEIARRFDVPLLVATSMRETPGTVICSTDRAKEDLGLMEEVAIRGVTHRKDLVKISLVGVPDEPGIAAKIFKAIQQHGLSLHLIVQSEHSGGRNDIAFLVPGDMIDGFREHLGELEGLVGAEESVVDEDVATVSIVGEGVQREPGIAARMFTALANERINLDLISTSNLMLTCVIPERSADEAVRALHREFFEDGTAEK
ncbi:MAG: aspartate kinase [Planctomycetes bacterium]|nr:aspartate kinase [Planctomycetota bacterium]